MRTPCSVDCVREAQQCRNTMDTGCGSAVCFSLWRCTVRTAAWTPRDRLHRFQSTADSVPCLHETVAWARGSEMAARRATAHALFAIEMLLAVVHSSAHTEQERLHVRVTLVCRMYGFRVVAWRPVRLCILSFIERRIDVRAERQREVCVLRNTIFL